MHSAQVPVDSILCTGEILAVCMCESYYIILKFGGGGDGVSDFVTSLA